MRITGTVTSIGDHEMRDVGRATDRVGIGIKTEGGRMVYLLGLSRDEVRAIAQSGGFMGPASIDLEAGEPKGPAR